LVFPGQISIEEAKKLPKTVIFGGEFDLPKRDYLAFAETMKKTDRFVGLHMMPGVSHEYYYHFDQ